MRHPCCSASARASRDDQASARAPPSDPPGALPLGSPSRAVALGTIHFGWVFEEGQPRPCKVRVGPPQTPNQWTECKGPRPLPEVQEAEPPGGSEGGALALTRS